MWPVFTKLYSLNIKRESTSGIRRYDLQLPILAKTNTNDEVLNVLR